MTHSSGTLHNLLTTSEVSVILMFSLSMAESLYNLPDFNQDIQNLYDFMICSFVM